MKNFTKKFKSFLTKNRNTKVFVTTLLAALTITGGVVYAGFGPNRPTFDYNNPADRVGSLTGPVFNSFVNTPEYGDERAFVDAKDAAVTTPGGFQDQVQVQPGKEYLVRLYVHNNANQNTNCLPEHKDASGNCTQVDATAPGVAQNTRVRVKLLPGLANGHGITGYISANNATPTQVYDTVDFRDNNEAFGVEYVPGSAKIENHANPNGAPISDSIVTDQGAPLGFSQMDGKYPGCFEFSAYVTLKVKVVTTKQTFTKQVRKAGDTNWSKSINVHPGDKVQWLLTYQNTGQVNFDDVDLSDQLPPHVTIVPGSVRYVDAGQDVAQQDGPLFTTGGINFGTWKPNGGFLVRFDTVAKDDFSPCDVTVRNIGFMKTKQTPNETQSTADVHITKTNCQPTTPPVTPTSTPPTTIPNTGAGSVVGIFSAATVAGAVFHRLFWRRLFGRGL